MSAKRQWSTPGKASKLIRTGATPVKIRNLKTSNKASAARMIEHSNYKRAFASLYKNYRGARKAIMTLIQNIVRKEINSFMKTDSILSQQCTIETMEKLNWDDIFFEMKHRIPVLFTTVLSAVTTRKTETDMKCLSTGRSLKPVIGMSMSMLLHMRCPSKFKLIQSLNGIELWRNGAQRRIFQHYNYIGLSMSRQTIMRLLSTLRVHADRDLKKMIEDIENINVRGPDDTIPAEESSDTTDRALTTSDEMEISPPPSNEQQSIDDEATDIETSFSEDESASSDSMSIVSLPSTDVSEETVPPGFTLVWDNVGKQVKARHQNSGKQNKMKLWALSYAAKNRIPSSHLDSHVTCPATDIPTEKFLPSITDVESIKARVKYVVSKMVVKHIPFFSDNFQTCVPRHIRHRYWRESSKQSEVINLGVLQEDPSTIAGTIKILSHLHQYVPVRNGELVQTLSFGDGLTCERHNDSHKARSNGATPSDRLQGLEPAVQEFHKRMLLMQDVIDQFFKGTSITEKGTLCHLRNVFGHRNVTKDVGDSFNHVSDFMLFVTLGYTILLTMSIMGMQNLEDEPMDWDEVDEMTKDEKIKYLDNLAAKIVDFIWRDFKVADILMENKEKAYEYCLCKEDKVGPMIECSGINCVRGKWFHLECVGLEVEDVPDDDWFCSGRCSASEKTPGKKGRSPDHIDHKHEYVAALLLHGLLDQTQRDCVRENDGPMLMRLWKMNIIQFHNRNHHKYVILAHRLIAGISGWLPVRLQKDLLWNRTVNLSGGPGKNLEMDLVNEMLNKEFKESLKDAGGNLTEETVSRHSQLVGHLGKRLDKFFCVNVSDVDEKQRIVAPARDFTEDIKLFVNLLKKEKLFDYVPGRAFKSFPNFDNTCASKHPARLNKKLKQLSQRLDRLPKIV